MDKLSNYDIVFIKLSKGNHLFNYKLDSSFFLNFENTIITDCNIDVAISLNKDQPHVFDMDFTVNGTIAAICDRCLDTINLPINYQFNLLVKQTEKIKENEHDITYISLADYQINVAKYIYDVCHLAVPMKILCAESDKKTCNTIVEKKLKELAPNNRSSKTEEDPRWDVLKTLVNPKKENE